jgi:hypothetical protein
MRAFPFLLIVAAGLFPGRAFADITKDQCVDANTRAQSLRREGKLGATRDQLRLCMDAACPAIVRSDCIQRLDDLDRVQPSIVFDVKDGAGNDLLAVSVTMDGRPLVDKLGGTALVVDPGPHTFVFASAGAAPVTQTFVLREGEKARVEHVVLAAKPGPVAPPPGPPPVKPVKPATTAPEPPGGAAQGPSGGSLRKTLGIVGVAAGGAGLLVGAIAGGVAISTNNTLKHDCTSGICSSRTTPRSDFDTYNTVTTLSTVGFVAGGVLGAAGVVLLVTAPKARDVAVTPVVGPGYLGMQGSF